MKKSILIILCALILSGCTENHQKEDGKIIFYDLPLSDYPFIIAELDEIDMD